MDVQLSHTSSICLGSNIYNLDSLIEDVWRDLGGRVARARISETVTNFRHNNADLFIPQLVRHQTCEQLEEEIHRGASR
jgi:hypothetical protein